jgi:carbon-monoxide dehydrogenase large subunit
VINAVVDALAEFGVDHVDMPATPEKVWSLMQEERS